MFPCNFDLRDVKVCGLDLPASVEVNEDLGIYMEQYVSREEQQHEPPYF